MYFTLYYSRFVVIQTFGLFSHTTVHSLENLASVFVVGGEELCQLLVDLCVILYAVSVNVKLLANQATFLLPHYGLRRRLDVQAMDQL